MKTNIFVTGILAMFISGSSLAATVVTDGKGIITGINNVSVKGQKWNVLFGNTWDKVEYGQDFSNLATQALFDLIAQGGELHASIFDYKPNAIAGCDTGFGGFVCNISTVASYSPSNYKYSYLNNYWQYGTAKDGAVTDQFSKYSTPYYNSTVGTLASWTQASAVPVPAAAFMFAPALVGLLGLRRKQRA